jgi:hypothetical protein
MEIQKREVIWEELYRERNTLIANKKEMMSQNEIEFFNSNKTKLVSENSEQIVSKLRNAIFTKLFESLDTDGDKSISYDDFNAKNLPENVLLALNGISQNIKENQEKLTEEDFIKSMEEIDQVIFNENIGVKL